MNAAIPNQAIKKEAYQTDLLTLGQKISLVVRLPVIKGFCYIFFSVLAIALPYSLAISLPVMLWMSLLTRKHEFPARYPREMKKLDPTDPMPGRKNRLHMARGEFYVGNHRGTGREAWLSWDDIMTHLYMLAATGGGKSEALWAMLANFMSCGSGFTLGDGKGTLEMIQQGRALARIFGREDEYFVINYLSPNKEIEYKVMSNTLNPYNFGTAAQLKESFASLALSGNAGQNQFFEDNAAVIIERLFPALVELRDKGLVNLDVRTIGSYMPLHRLFELSQNDNVSLQSRSYISAYLETAGYDESKGKKQSAEVIKMHGQFVTHFAKAISSMSIQYRDIYLVDQGDINMRDIINNRRLLLFSLPAMDKSGAELKNLGKILLTAQKAGIAADVGDVLEGSVAETSLRLSRNYGVPYALGYDEWAFYAIEDMALVPAQVRSLRHTAIYSAQDYAGTERAGELDAESVFANCRVKFFGALEEAGKSWSRIRDLIGEVRRAYNNNYRYLPGVLGGRFILDREKTEITHRAEIEIGDLQRQISGQFYLFMRGKLSPITFLYTDLEGRKKKAAKGNDFKINRFVKVFPPSDKELAQIDASESFMDLMYGKDQLFEAPGILSSLRKCVTETSGETMLALKKFVQDHSVRLGVTDQADEAELPPDHETAALLNAFFLPEGDVAAAETGQVPEESQTGIYVEDPLLAQTIQAKQSIITSQESLPGATILSDRQTQEILDDMTEINMLLGMSSDASRLQAEMTVQRIGKQCYYLAPPRPSPLQREAVADLKKRVDDMLS